MGQEGWISIRNVPKAKPKSGTSLGAFYLRLLSRFFDSNKICNLCKGQGYTLSKRREVKELAMIKFKGIDSLEKLKKLKGIQISDVIREILSYELEQRKVCKKCNEKHFTPISTKAQKKSKNKTKKKKIKKK